MPPDDGLEGLEGQAASLVRLLAVQPPTWADDGFRASVETVRAQLAPICSVETLDSSRSRESHARPGSACASRSAHDRLVHCPVEVAYAVRWLELRRKVRCPPWPEMTALEALRTVVAESR
ncbi:MAG TPA: hypothetical protein VF763_00610 [Candidatus Limnocylindrales bacterium]